MAEPDQAAARSVIFGPVVAGASRVPLLDRVIRLGGRGPSWRAG
ncbi:MULTISPECIES: hypothetical protein [unclassified Micromonospora]